MIFLEINLLDFFYQSPIIPLALSALITFIIIMQCFVKRMFFKVRLILSFLLTFAAGLLFFFHTEIQNSNQDFWKYTELFSLLGIDLIVCMLFFTTIDLSLSNEKLHKILTKSLDETKYFVLLDKKDKIKEISTLLSNDLDIKPENAIRKNFFDVIENKYRLVGLNGEEASKKMIKKYFEHYERKVQEGSKTTLELNILDDNAKHDALYFNENTVFSRGKYKGRILIGDKKNEETLVGMEKELNEKNSELDLIRSRFLSILYKTSDGIYFNNLNDKSIWFNDILVKRLFLNGNTIDSNDYYANIHPDDMPLYQDVLNNITDEYSITYRYNTGSYYVYVKEQGNKVISGNTIELCGTMSVIDNYRYEKTDTALDSVGSEPEMLARFKALETNDAVFEVVHFRVATIPEINEKYGRGIGNMMLSEYVNFFKQTFIVDNYIYRVSGLEFVAFITNYNKMEMLKSQLRNEQHLLKPSATLGGEKIQTEVYMGISYSNDTPNPSDALSNAKNALKIAANDNYQSSYAYFKDLR